jgi:NADPH-dependent 2,4-dienoyl-CoA reductase/sulfur reductase-like enzyme
MRDGNPRRHVRHALVIETDVAVIGAGPAGLSAAIGAARSGARVDLIDAAPAPGGQYWMQSVLAEKTGAPQARAGTAAVARAEHAGVRIHRNAEVWSVFPDLRVLGMAAATPIEIAPRALVVATGAHDRVMPFPGWTLPGVVTAGAAQRLAKLAGVPAGTRVVIAGSGPFLFVVARALRDTGAEIVAHVEAQRPSLALVAHLARFPERWGEALALLAPASRAGLRTGAIVTCARGSERVNAVDIAPLDPAGRIDRTRIETVANVDALVVGWGFRPAVDVTALLRCRHAYDEAAGGWHVVADPSTGATSRAHVFAAGEVTGVAGARPAQLAGELAGIAAAADAGFPDRPSPGLQRRLARARRFVAALNRAATPPRAVDELAEPSTIVCRCESITRGEITAALDDGAQGVLGVKLWTRAGMGPCQGRMCSWAIARIASPGNPARAGFNQPRIPIRPVPLGLVAAALSDGSDLPTVDVEHDPGDEARAF